MREQKDHKNAKLSKYEKHMKKYPTVMCCCARTSYHSGGKHSHTRFDNCARALDARISVLRSFPVLLQLS